MQVTLTIDGRMAIPVRAIPFVTGFELSPDELAELASAPTTLSRYVGSAVLEFENRQRLATFTLDAASGYRAMTPRDWEFSKVEIQCLGQKLKAAERDEGENWAEWRRLAITALPHACFVWLDDFAEWHQQNRPHCMPRKPENLRDGEFMELLANGPSPDMDEEVIDRIELAPFIPREFESLIVEGFSSTQAEPDNGCAISEAATVSNDTDTTNHPSESLREQYPKTRRDGLRIEMESGWNDYIRQHRRNPTARALFDFLAKKADSDLGDGKIVEYDQENDALIWRRSDGGLTTTGFKAFTGRFTKLKNPS